MVTTPDLLTRGPQGWRGARALSTQLDVVVTVEHICCNMMMTMTMTFKIITHDHDHHDDDDEEEEEEEDNKNTASQ